MTYELLEDAAEDLADIDDWVRNTFGEKKADVTRADLVRAFEDLAKFPGLGRPQPETSSLPVRFFHVWPYWIVYSAGTPLLIRHVWHGARDLKRLAEQGL